MTEPNDTESIGGNRFFSRELMAGIPWAVGSRFILFFVYLATSIVIVRGLGQESYGLYRLCWNIAEYLLIVCSMGLNTAIVRFVPELRVKKSHAGIVRLLTKTVFIQAFMLLPVGALLYALKPYLDDWFFKGDSHLLLLFTMLLVAGRLGRAFTEDVLTALFRIRAVSIIGVAYGALWLGATAVGLNLYPSPEMALVAQAGALIVATAAAATLLLQQLRCFDYQANAEGIGKRRVLGIALPRQLNQMASLLTQRYSEIFFVGYFFTPATVAIYELGNWLPFALITFLPLALYNLFTSGFAEAYSRDPNCLGRLVASCYKALILIAVPISAFGAFFGNDAIRILYGQEMIEAGPVASAFFVIHLLPLISIPLAMAIVTKEKIMHMQPLIVMTIIVNLTLDWLLIPRYEILGACIAVVATFALTIPIRLYVAARLVGGIYFPMRFFLKSVAVLFPLAFVFSRLVDTPNLPALIGLTLGYGAAYVGILRALRFIRPEDAAEIRDMGFTRLNRLLDFFIAAKNN